MTATTAAKPLGFAMPVKTAKAKRYPWIIEAAFQRENLPGGPGRARAGAKDKGASSGPVVL